MLLLRLFATVELGSYQVFGASLSFLVVFSVSSFQHWNEISLQVAGAPSFLGDYF